MKRLISDRELVDYVSGQLSRQDTKILHEKAKANGETDLLLHVQLASLECQKAMANDLLGEDTFMKDEESQDLSQWAVAAKNLFENINFNIH